MKRLIFSVLLLFFLCVSGGYAQTKHDRNVERYKSSWDRLIPRYAKLQFAGSMGFLSAGVGWDYGRSKHWETDVLLGFVPAFKHDDTKVTLTLKQNYMPWKIHFSQKFMFEPLACGIYINTIFSDNFWARTPIKYPSNKYYSFSTRIRTHVFLGERITLNFDPEKRGGEIDEQTEQRPVGKSLPDFEWVKRFMYSSGKSRNKGYFSFNLHSYGDSRRKGGLFTGRDGQGNAGE